MADQLVAQAEVTTEGAGVGSPPGAGAAAGSPPTAGPPAAAGGGLANETPAAADDCAVTAEGTPITIPVLANDRDGDGDLLMPDVTTAPAHGRAEVNPDGTITYTPAAGDDGAVRDGFAYEVRDGLGGADGARVFVLINPVDGQVSQHALAGVDAATLPSLARACAAATALGVAELGGDDVAVPPPAPGHRTEVEVEPGQRLALQGEAFADARYIVVNEGLLVVLPDGRTVFLAGFVDAAESGRPPVLSVAGGPAVAGDALLASLEPFDGGDEGQVDVTAGRAHGGGAGFTPYDPGALPAGLDPLGPLGPTEIGNRLATLEPDDEPELLPGDDVTPPPPPPPPPPPVLGPQANDDSGRTPEETPIRIDALDNDIAFLPDGTPLRAQAPDLEITSFEQPDNGTVVLNPDGTFTYTPDPEFTGTDSWTYQVRNPNGLTDTATVTVEVTPVNDPPEIEGDASPNATISEVTSGSTYSSAIPLGAIPPSRPPLPDSEINGVDQGNLVLNEAGDAEIIFVDEYATFVNTLGVYLIGADGTIQDPKIVFPAVDHAEPLRDAAGNPIPGNTDRPGGGPLSPGDSVSLSDLYSPAELQPGTRFGLFIIQEGQSRNPGIDFESGSFRFVDAGGATASITDTAPNLVWTSPTGAQVVVQGGIFHTADATAGSPLGNPLNTSGSGQLISGLQPGAPGLTVVYEDLALGGGSDRDFNDHLFRIRIPATTGVTLVPRPVPLVPNLTLSDPDDAELAGATVVIAEGRQPGDVLGLDGLSIGPGGFIAGTNIRVLSDGSDGVLELAGRDSIATYQEVLRSVTYDNADPTGGIRRFDLRIEDADGEVSDPFAITLGIPEPQIGTEGGETLTGTDETDVLLGRAGDDTLLGRGGDDGLAGGAGDDTVSGEAGDDVLDGGEGDDTLSGGAGDDVMRGGPGADALEGGSGADTFVYQSLDDRGDRIVGFNATDGDQIDVTELLRGFDAGASDINDFVSLSGPVGGDRVLSVDVDGAGAAFAPIAIATLIAPEGVTTVQEMFDNGNLAA